MQNAKTNNSEVYSFGWKDPRKMTPEELLVDYFSHQAQRHSPLTQEVEMERHILFLLNIAAVALCVATLSICWPTLSEIARVIAQY